MSHPLLRLVILAVDDLPRSVAFYRCAFGWPVAIEVPVYVEFALTEDSGVGLYRRDSFALNTGLAPQRCADGAITASELYLRVDDLDAAIARLCEAGARELSARAARPWGDTAAYFADPDGNVLVVAIHTQTADAA